MKKQTAEMTSTTKEPNPIEKHSQDLDNILYDAHRVRGLLQMFDEAMEKEMEGLSKLEPNSASVKLTRERYEHIICSALDSARVALDHIIDEIGDV